MKEYSLLEQHMSYTFRDKQLLQLALTHSSFANESHNPAGSYERLEFLGDSLLGFVVADFLYREHADWPEGELTKARAALVCEEACCGFCREMGVGDFLRLSHGEQRNGGRERASILADVFESLTAAIYLDSDYEQARTFVLRFTKPLLHKLRNKAPFRDYKTRLQELVQQNPGEKLTYVLTGESGPDHDKHFTVEVHLNSNVIGKGGGHSKKDAEQQAAREALKLMGY